jgi:hypothetical protein
MRHPAAVTTCKIFLGVSATAVVMSAAGCGATESTCNELQRTCGCDDRPACPGDGAAGKAGASGAGVGGMGGGDASDGTAGETDGQVADVGSGGKSGAGGSAGSSGTAGTAGAAGAGGKGGAAGAGGTRDDAAADAAVADIGLDVASETGDDALDASIDQGQTLDATEEHDAVEAGLDAVDMGPTCDVTKSPSVEDCLIDEQYGVFVSPMGDDLTGNGTRAAPYATLGTATKAAVSRSLRVYACDQGSGYAEQVVLPEGMKVHGGFDCIDWTYGTTRRAVVHAPTSPALTIHAVSTGVLVEDVEFDAPDAAGIGESSIGALIDVSSNVVLRRTRIVAGKGGEGTGGANGAKGGDAPEVTAGLAGSPALCPATVAAQLGGAWPQASTCGSRGGAGGTATQGSDGSAGVPGNPRANVVPPDVDNGGAKGVTGGDGGVGSPGKAGAPGVASPTAGLFTSAGYTPASSSQAATGVDGYVGQGGGGGGASNAADLCIGASGGAGGMGGCGGKGGWGGAGGGASIALLSWTTQLTLETCELIAHAGGPGGKGGVGGAGGSGKAGAAGGAAFVSDGGTVVGKGGRGGTGGNGGLGGPGAGGTGGPSYALVYKGQPPTRTALTLTPGSPGSGGPGGTSGSTTAPSGDAGQAATEFSVP